MFSQRTAWNRQINLLSQRRAELERRGVEILDLACSNPTEQGFVYPPEFYRALTDERSAAYRPEPLGLLTARAAVSNYYRRKGCSADPQQSWLAAGTSEIYTQLMWLLCDPGDQILIPRPGYSLFDYFGDLAGVQRLTYDLVYDGRWQLDLNSIRDQVKKSARLRALVVISPHNPTGNFLNKNELAALEELCGAHGLALIVDEVFSDYALGDDADRVSCALGERTCLCFILSGLSKVAALPQFKLAWGAACGPAVRVSEAMARLEIIADSFLSVSTPVQLALPDMFEKSPAMQEQIRARCRANVQEIQHVFHGSPLTLLNVEGGWTGLIRLPQVNRLDDSGWADQLLEHDHLWIQPGYLFDFPPGSPPHLALSLLTPPESFRKGLTRLNNRVDKIWRVK